MEAGFDADRIFGVVTAIALLLFLLPQVVPLSPERHRQFRRGAGLLVGGALAAAAMLALGWASGAG
jgi:hypothetical protein